MTDRDQPGGGDPVEGAAEEGGEEVPFAFDDDTPDEEMVAADQPVEVDDGGPDWDAMSRDHSDLDAFTSAEYLQGTTQEYQGLAEEVTRAAGEEWEQQAVAATVPGVDSGLVGFDDVTGSRGDSEEDYEATEQAASSDDDAAVRREDDDPDVEAVEVVLEGRRLLCDPGFGMSLLRPIPMVDRAEDNYLPGWRYRLRRTEEGHWALHRLREQGWEVAHTTDELEVKPVDVVIGHHFTSTFPGSHFTTGLMVTKHLPGRHVTVTHESLTVRTPGQPTEHRPLREGEIEQWLAVLEVPLHPEETAGLRETLQRLGRPRS